MKTGAVVFACVVTLAFASAQSKQAAEPHPLQRSAEERIVESKIRKAFEDIQNKNTAGFASILSQDVVEVEEDGKPHDGNAELAEVAALESFNYTLSNFHFRAIRPSAMLVRYDADYSGKTGGESFHNNSAIAEIWERQKGEWKIFYFQATPIK